MKLLVFTDTHGSERAEERIIKKAKRNKPDALLCCGDFTIFMHEPERFLQRMNALNIPLFLIHGNHEDEDEVEKLTTKYEHITFIHNKITRHKNIVVMGYGGDGFSLKDPAFKKIARQFQKELEKHSDAIHILLLHQPPHKSGIDLIYGEHAGNMTTKEFIEKQKIHVVFAGHLHENSGKEHKDKHTRYINPGPYGRIIRL